MKLNGKSVEMSGIRGTDLPFSCTVNTSASMMRLEVFDAQSCPIAQFWRVQVSEQYYWLQPSCYIKFSMLNSARAYRNLGILLGILLSRLGFK